jgi:hypothetical protein
VIPFVVENGSGLSNATSYVALDEADDLAVLNIHNSDTWLALTADDKRNLLIYASRILDARTTWNGERVTLSQGLEWPRKGLIDRYGNAVSGAAVPYNVRWAVVEFAKWSMTEDRLSRTQPDNVVSEVKVDSILLKFADPTLIASEQFKTPDIVTDLLRGLGSVRHSTRKVTFGRLKAV